MLDQDPHESLHRAEEGSVNHDGLVTSIVGADVVNPEALRKLEVQLNSRHLMGSPNSVTRLDRDLWTVERSPAFIENEL